MRIILTILRTPVANLFSSKDAAEDMPIKGRGDKISDIPRKPKKAPEPISNGANVSNGKHAANLEVPTNDLKRSRIDDEEAPQPKKAKMAFRPANDVEVINLDVDQDTGAFVILDD